MPAPSPADQPHSFGSPLPEAWLDHARVLASGFGLGDLGSLAGAGEGLSEQSPSEEELAEERAAEALLGRRATAGERAALQGAVRSIVLLGRLSQQVAPAALDGAVVASLHAGHREQRASDVVGSLAVIRAPSALDDRVARLLGRGAGPAVDPAVDPAGGPAGGPGIQQELSRGPRSAPSVLDDLVEQACEDPEGTMVQGMARRLAGMGAPLHLDERVSDSLGGSGLPARPGVAGGATAEADAGGGEAAASTRAAGGRGRLSSSIWASGLTAAAAAALIVVFVARSNSSDPSGSPSVDSGASATVAETRGYPQFVIRRRDAADLSPAVRDILRTLGADGFGGRS